MAKLAKMLCALLLVAGCGGEGRQNAVKTTGDAEAPDIDLVVDALRTYCRACHAVGGLRFLRSDDNREVWDYIHTNDAPNAGVLWSEAIVRTLSWPSDEAPPFDRPMDPGTGRDWMPKGFKRLELAEARHGDEPLRRVLLRELRKERND